MPSFCFISKLVGQVIVSQLNDHVISNGLENENHSVYKVGHSTETTVLSIMNEVHLFLSKGEATALVLFDQSAFFDKIEHAPLLNCLISWFCIDTLMLKWFKSYLTDRSGCIETACTLSDVRKFLYGVLQVSVLGLILFSLYTTPQ